MPYDVSIIIPYYNTCQGLKRLLGTIPNLPSIEVIVVDDKSTENKDAFIKLKEEYKQVKFLENEKEVKGAGAARNIGLKEATGKWLVFADADDYFLTDFFPTIESYFESEEDIIYFTPTSIVLGTEKTGKRHLRYVEFIKEYKKRQNQAGECIVRYEFVVPWSKMIRRALVEKHQICFSETMVSNDVMFAVYCGYYGRSIQVSDEQIYCVTESEGSLTRTVNSTNFQTRLDIYIEKFKFLKSKLSKTNLKALEVNALDYFMVAAKYKLGVKQVLILSYKIGKCGMPPFRKKHFSITGIRGIISRLIKKKKEASK